jgi:hypothetical protein
MPILRKKNGRLDIRKLIAASVIGGAVPSILDLDPISYYDAQLSTIGYGVGNKVASWEDLGSLGLDFAQATPALQPTEETSTLPEIRFASTHIMKTASHAAMSDFTVAILARTTEPAAGGVQFYQKPVILSTETPGVVDDWAFYMSSGKIGLTVRDGAVDLGGDTWNDGNSFIYIASRDASEVTSDMYGAQAPFSSLAADGTTGNGSGNTTDASYQLGVGGNGATNRTVDLNISAIAIIPRLLTAAEREIIRRQWVREYSLNDFKFTVKTDNTGTSNNDQFTIPLYSGETYNFTVTYDGQETTHSTDSDLTLTFPSGAGTYSINISGLFPRIYFNNAGDKAKLISVTNYGDVGWGSDFSMAFHGCTSCTDFGSGLPTNITNLYRAWYSCTSATSFPEVSGLTGLTNIAEAWRNCGSATSFPEVNECVLITNLTRAWNASAAAPSFPSISDLVNAERIDYAWSGCTGCTTVPSLPTSSTALTNCQESFSNIGGGMAGTVEELWNATNFPNISTYTDCFTGATGLTNYGDIPNGWKGL